MKIAAKTIIAAAVAAAGVALSASSASAYVACSGSGECWHVHRHANYNYAPTYGVVVHPDSWRWGRADHYRWHEHAGRGYWNNGAWTRF